MLEEEEEEEEEIGVGVTLISLSDGPNRREGVREGRERMRVCAMNEG